MEKLFAPHILERGYNYYLEDAVENISVDDDGITATVYGLEDYEVEINIEHNIIGDMYCSCPYAEDGNNCKHMAAVLFEWEENSEDMDAEDVDGESFDDEEPLLFKNAETTKRYSRKLEDVKKLIVQADSSIVQEFLAELLMNNEKQLIRFYNLINNSNGFVDTGLYKKQIDKITDHYLGRECFISYYEADGFINDLEEILTKDVRQMMDNQQYMSSFEIMNYIYVLMGNVDMDDSDGGTGMLADQIYNLWLELLDNVNYDEKCRMFEWFTDHLDGSVIDYLEEYIEQIIMDEFQEDEFKQKKIDFVQKMIEQSAKKESDWSRSYSMGKWSVCYLDMIKNKKNGKELVEQFCREYWSNSTVRRYYINRCMKTKDYDKALLVLDECIVLDKSYQGLLTEYCELKKEIYKKQGDTEAYINELWKLELEYKAGDLNIFKELKSQYEAEEWVDKREELFLKLPKYSHIERLYKEEKLYDRLLEFVLKSQGLYAVQEYENILKKYYPEEILDKYKMEVMKMALYTGDRRKYQQLVSLLRRMKKMKGGTKMVADIVDDWRIQYRNRPAMMDELKRL